MRYLPFLRWHTLRWLLLILATAIFAGGLLYDNTLSRSISRNLADVQEKAYPILEKTNLLMLKLKLIQEEFSNAVNTLDGSKLALIKFDEEEFLSLLSQLERLTENREHLVSIRSVFKEYLELGGRISDYLIQHNGDFISIQPLITDYGNKRTILTEELEKLSLESNRNFEATIKDAQANSDLMLRVSLGSSIVGVLLIGGYLGIIMNLNRRLMLINQNLEAQVKARTQELESFVYTVSHDLKSPIVSMHGMASLLLKKCGDQLDEKAKHYLDRIIANSNFMEELIMDLLTLSRVGRKQQNPEKADVRTVLQQILDIHKDRFAQQKVEVVVQPSVPNFVHDRVELTQLFQNLITNAAKFMGDQPHPRIEIGGRTSKDRVEFYVKDNGIGIDPAYHEKVFGVFQRLQDVKVEGTGIGLSIVKKIVDLVGGRVWIESKKGEGATFFIRFPKSERRSRVVLEQYEMRRFLSDS